MFYLMLRCGLRVEEVAELTLSDIDFRRGKILVQNGKGECLGINLFRKKDLNLFKAELERVGNNDYFEKALENLTVSNKLDLRPVRVGSLYCNEVDYEEDLKAVQSYLLSR